MRFRQWFEQEVTIDKLPGIAQRAASYFKGGRVETFRTSVEVYTPYNQKIVFAFSKSNDRPSLFISFTRDEDRSKVGASLQSGTKQLMDDFDKAMAFLSQYDVAVEFNAVGMPVGSADAHPKRMRRSSIYATILSRHGYVRDTVDFNRGNECYVPRRMLEAPQMKTPPQATKQAQAPRPAYDPEDIILEP